VALLKKFSPRETKSLSPFLKMIDASPPQFFLFLLLRADLGDPPSLVGSRPLRTSVLGPSAVFFKDQVEKD